MVAYLQMLDSHVTSLVNGVVWCIALPSNLDLSNLLLNEFLCFLIQEAARGRLLIAHLLVSQLRTWKVKVAWHA